jgi:hypothetical protein
MADAEPVKAPAIAIQNTSIFGFTRMVDMLGNPFSSQASSPAKAASLLLALQSVAEQSARAGFFNLRHDV